MKKTLIYTIITVDVVIKKKKHVRCTGIGHSSLRMRNKLMLDVQAIYGHMRKHPEYGNFRN